MILRIAQPEKHAMSQQTWTAVDHYLDDVLVGHDAALDAALRESAQAALPPINVAPTQGKLLNLLARSIGARSILEIGTLGGYSTIWLARALPADGRLISLEIDRRHAEVARANIARAGLEQRVEVRVGRALDALAQLGEQAAGPFDLFFIDADKPNIPAYFSWALRLARPGSLIVVDNVVRDGAVIEADSADASVQGVRRLNELMASEPRVAATVIQTVGVKGYDGFALALVTRL
jgi:predicted O-methyltransferase YrrM